MLSDLAIAQKAELKHIHQIADQLGLTPDDLDMYGSPYVAKLRLESLSNLKDRPNAKYVDVTAITPTPLGEGKTTTSVGLAQAMKHIGKRAIVTLRQPRKGQPLVSKVAQPAAAIPKLCRWSCLTYISQVTSTR